MLGNTGNTHLLVSASLEVFVSALTAIVNNKLARLVYPLAVLVERLSHAITLP